MNWLDDEKFIMVRYSVLHTIGGGRDFAKAMVYAYIESFPKKKCSQSYQDIARVLNIKYPALKKIIGKLIAEGWIVSRERKWDPTEGKRYNVLRINTKKPIKFYNDDN